MVRESHGMSLIFVGWVIATLHMVWQQADGFAYAPNFITKIIEEQTSIAPRGLLQIDPVADGSSNSRETVSAPQQQQPSSASTSTQATIVRLKKPETTTIVRTRFPPEPNGYLHLGHAKAVSFNFAVARAFGGVCHMRMDDTNPSKEDVEYVNSILEDVKWIQDGLYDGDDKPWYGKVRKTSDYFDLIYECAVALIQSGDAYVDSLSAEEMREYRGTLTEPGRDSPYRTRTVEENLQLFQDMKEGKYPEGAHVLRAKIDMSSPNINMRDPTLYRIKHESHQETGDKWCIYPLYDFSHPIADSVENITHSLCTLEFEDHRPFYDWTLEKLIPTGLVTTPSQQIEFSRLNIKSTVLSKRKLIQLVQEKHVTGWDDPRMPTLSGMRRRGIPPSALRLFCERVGISKADSNIDYSVLEDCIRETMDNTCPRAFCVMNPLKVTITNLAEGVVEDFVVDKHPKLQGMGKRTIPFSNTVYIERDDFFDIDGVEGQANGGRPPKGFKRLLPNKGKVRLRYAYVIQCDEVVRDPDTNEAIELKCSYFPDTRAGVTPDGMERVNGIIHWIEASTAVQCIINQYDRLFLTEEPGKESGNFLKDINPNSLEILKGAVVEPSVADNAENILAEIHKQHTAASSVTKKVIYPSSLAYQFERSGYFALDKSSTGRENLVMNRVVALRDTWGVKKKDDVTVGQDATRTRGNDKSKQVSKSSDEPTEDIRRVSFRAATILSARPHPEGDTLAICEIDCGDKDDYGVLKPRTVVAGLAKKIPIDKIVGQRVVAVTNLKPAKMLGVESTAMLLAASTTGENEEEKVELLTVSDSVPNGELLSFEGLEPSKPDSMLKSKGAIKAWERARNGLRSNEQGEVVYSKEGSVHHRIISSAGPIQSTFTNAIIQ